MSCACITGASSGIGKEFARQLSRQGYDLILVARSRDKLEQVASASGADCEIVICDLSKEAECKKLVALLAERRVDLLVNNAGFGNVGLFEENDPARDLEMIDVNVRAVHLLTHGMLRQMKERGRGTIVNVASIAGLMPGGPLMATYYATKAYVASMTGAIATELQAEGSAVKIAALCPGPVHTDFNRVAGVKFALPGISAKKCVTDCLKGLRRGKTVIVPGTLLSAGSVLGRCLPRNMVLKILMHAQRKKTEKAG